MQYTLHNIVYCITMAFMDNQIFEKWQVQLRKGFIELCVLKVLHNKAKAYGLEILLSLKDHGVSVNEGTLYPLLNRMQKNGWLESTWDTQTESGHPRRFYQLSETGKVLLPQMLEAYRNNNHSLKLMEKDS